MDYRTDLGTHITLDGGAIVTVTERIPLSDTVCINCGHAGGCIELVAQEAQRQPWIGIRCQRCGFSMLNEAPSNITPSA